MSIRKNLPYLRREKGFSQEELAYKLGVSRQAVSKWESGAAFPETEKILTICKIFDCSLDELMNTNIEESKKDQERKYSLNDLVEEITDIVKRTFNMFDNMSFKTFVRFLFEIFILFVLILLLHIPFSRITNLGYNVFVHIPGNISQVLISLWHFITESVYIVIAVISFVYIYKIRFLDKFDYVEKQQRKADQTGEKIQVENAKKVKKIEVKEYDFGVFSFMGKIAIVLVKAFFAFLSLPFISLLFLAFAGILIAIVMGFEGVIFFSVFVLLLAVIISSIALLYVIYNFLINRKSDWRKLFVVFVISIAGLGIGTGISVLEFSKMSISSEVSSKVESISSFETFEMNDSLYLGWVPYFIEYIEDDSLGDDIKFEAIYYTVFTKDVVFSEDSTTGDIYIYPQRVNTLNFRELYDILIEDLKDKRVSNYSTLGDIQIKIYGSKENITKLERNKYRYVSD
ncbi:MAG: helix-turn-helix transcriptional regulator [Candidatus Dojkabacteria bacterium]